MDQEPGKPPLRDGRSPPQDARFFGGAAGLLRLRSAGLPSGTLGYVQVGCSIRVTVLGAMMLGAAAAAGAHEIGGSAAACKPSKPTSATQLQFGSGGALNTGTSSAQISCGAVRTSTASPTNLWVDYFDHTTTDKVTCSVTVWDALTTQTSWSQAQSSAISTAVSGAFHFSIPSSAVGIVDVLCTLPPISSTGGQSSIAGYNLQ